MARTGNVERRPKSGREGGAVDEANSSDANVTGVRAFLELIAAEPRLSAAAIQTVGEKGWDGFVLAVVRL